MEQMKSRRGGRPDLEIEQGKTLASNSAGSAEEAWGTGTPAGQERLKKRVAWIVKACGLRPGIRALEFGCGTGLITSGVADTGAEITAVDISPELLKEARSRVRSKQVTFIEGNLEKPTFLEDAAFDVIYGVSILHHLDLERSLGTLVSRLKPGGTFAFSEPNMLNPLNRFFFFTNNMERRKRLGMTPSEMAFYPWELKKILENAGLKIQSLKHRDFLHPSVPKPMIPLVQFGELIAENLPLIRSISGSLWVHGWKPDLVA